MKKLPIAVAMASLVLMSALSGCKTLQSVLGPGAAPIVQAATYAAVAVAVGNDPSSQQEKAGRIKAIAQELLLIDQGETATLTAIEAAVNARIASMGLPPADVAAAEILTATLAQAVQLELSNATNGVVSPTAQVAIAQVLNDVIAATEVYGV